jgi:hypothetical protein
MVNMVNVVEHVMSYARTWPADHVPRQLGHSGMINMMRAISTWDRLILIS